MPGVAFPPPRTADQDVTTELDPTLLEGVEGAMATPEPSSSTAAPGRSESAVPVPEKKKITLDEYNCCKALKLQQIAASPDLDKNGECLDYDDFKPGDDPDNIQIDYQMPAPSPPTSIPPLEDAPMSMSLATTQSQVSTGPSTVPSAMEHTFTAANRAPGFGRGLPVQRTSQIRLGALQDSTSPMQIGMPHSMSLLPLTSSQQITPMQVAPPCQTTMAGRISALTTLTYSSEAPGLTSTTEDELLKGATLPCSPWREAGLLNMTIPVELTEGHRKMMDALRCLDVDRLQFICESAQALS